MTRGYISTKEKGNQGEDAAALYLVEHGCHILERNFHSRYGEIDLIARDGIYLIFVEVKARRDSRKGTAAEAVNFRKQRKILLTFQYYRMLHHIPEDMPVRFDVIEFYYPNTFHWIKNAFEYYI